MLWHFPPFVETAAGRRRRKENAWLSNARLRGRRRRSAASAAAPGRKALPRTPFPQKRRAFAAFALAGKRRGRFFRQGRRRFFLAPGENSRMPT